MFVRVLFVIFLSTFLFFRSDTCALDITATGGWSETIDFNDLISGAGSDLTGTYESATNATVLDITNAIGGGDKWRVDMQRSDSTWHANFTLFIKRQAMGGLTGGTTYTEIRTITDTFFTGKANKSGINCQYQLTGMSVSIPPNTYSTTVTFTIVDT
jgi:hypothetical protein